MLVTSTILRVASPSFLCIYNIHTHTHRIYIDIGYMLYDGDIRQTLNPTPKP